MAHALNRNEGVSSIHKLIEMAAKGRFRRFDGKSIETLKEHGYSIDEIHRFVAPRRTLARRIEKEEPLTVSENDSAQRLLNIAELAERILGDKERAQRWLRTPSRALNKVVPLDLLESETGARLVEEELLRIEYGIYF
ncbi:antitoxin Xre/MbcA/ParS toxin-binding domain-containing protein [Neorhizobium alkalisoli]|uniref:antitoxin Xre/MbcA/ParS toxin-binding domain-containing protein n=1 Tax=Neorhizobium alkalisoli TaxID=528178 RepID=UPI000CF9B20C|nr:MbcA/ParS/Xre antitoxin family protein [Neorhizobium alkalisoli]